MNTFEQMDQELMGEAPAEKSTPFSTPYPISFRMPNAPFIYPPQEEVPPQEEREQIDESIKPVRDTSVYDLMDDELGVEPSKPGMFRAGMRASIPQLAMHGLPETPVQPEKISEMVKYGLGKFTYDWPLYLTGGAIGSRGGPVLAAAGAFAFPMGAERAIMHRLNRGEVKSARDFAYRLGDSLLEAGKGGATGVATYYVGLLGKLFGGKIPGLSAIALGKIPSVSTKIPREMAVGMGKRIGETVGATTGMVTTEAALEGEVPQSKDYISAFILLSMLHIIGVSPSKLKMLYKRKGITPQKVVKDVHEGKAKEVQDLLDEIPEPEESTRSGENIFSAKDENGEYTVSDELIKQNADQGLPEAQMEWEARQLERAALEEAKKTEGETKKLTVNEERAEEIAEKIVNEAKLTTSEKRFVKKNKTLVDEKVGEIEKSVEAEESMKADEAKLAAMKEPYEPPETEVDTSLKLTEGAKENERLTTIYNALKDRIPTWQAERLKELAEKDPALWDATDRLFVKDMTEQYEKTLAEPTPQPTLYDEKIIEGLRPPYGGLEAPEIEAMLEKGRAESKPDESLTKEEAVERAVAPKIYEDPQFEKIRAHPNLFLANADRRLQGAKNDPTKIERVLEDLSKLTQLEPTDFPSPERYISFQGKASELLDLARRGKEELSKTASAEEQAKALDDLLELDIEKFEARKKSSGPMLFDLGGATGYALEQAYKSSVELLRRVPPTVKSLRKISRGIFLEGKEKYSEFRTRMKEIVGDLWDSIKHLARQAYNEAKNWKILTDESGMIVWHGTKTKFDRFKDEFMGSGTGGQMKGWGHYLTTEKEVAEWYAKSVGQRGVRPKITLGGVDLSDIISAAEADFLARDVAMWYSKGPARTKYIKDYIEKKYEWELKTIDLLEHSEDTADTRRILSEARETAKNIEKYKDKEIKVEPLKFVHKVHIPKESEWLNLDEPVPDRQATKIAEGLAKLLADTDFVKNRPGRAGIARALIKTLGRPAKPYGEDIQNDLRTILGSKKAASKFLLDVGIPGNTFIGETSGVRNYVVFDENLPEVRETYTLDTLGMQQIYEKIVNRLGRTTDKNKVLTQRYIEKRDSIKSKATEVDLTDILKFGKLKGLDEGDIRKLSGNTFGWLKRDVTKLSRDEADALKLRILEMEPTKILPAEQLIRQSQEVSDRTKNQLRRIINLNDVDDLDLMIYLEDARAQLGMPVGKYNDIMINKVIGAIDLMNTLAPSEGKVSLFGFLVPAIRVLGNRFVTPWRIAEYNRLQAVIPYYRAGSKIFEGLDVKSLEAITDYREGKLSESQMSPQELEASRLLDIIYKKLYKDLGIEEEEVENYSPRRKPFFSEDDKIKWTFSREAIKDFDFWAEYKRTGELKETEKNAKTLLSRYIRVGFRKKYYNTALEAVRPIMEEMSPERKDFATRWINTVIKKRPSVSEKLVNRAIERMAHTTGFKTEQGRRYLREYGSALMNLNYVAFMGLRPKLAIRNLLQQWLIVNEYGLSPYLKGRASARSPEIEAIIEKSPFVKLRLQQFIMEEFSGGKFANWSKELRDKAMFMYRAAETDNVKTSFATGYLLAKAKHPKMPESYWIKAGEKAVTNTQWLYGLDLPLIMQTPEGKLATQYSSWGFWYADHIYRMFKEHKLSTRGARTAAQAVILAGLYYSTGVDFLETMGFGAMPQKLGYIPTLLYDFLKTIFALTTTRGGDVESVGGQFKRDLPGLVPGYLGAKEALEAVENQDLANYLLYMKKKEAEGRSAYKGY